MEEEKKAFIYRYKEKLLLLLYYTSTTTVRYQKYIWMIFLFLHSHVERQEVRKPEEKRFTGKIKTREEKETRKKRRKKTQTTPYTKSKGRQEFHTHKPTLKRSSHGNFEDNRGEG